MTLSTRIEAGQPSRELFEEAWTFLHGMTPAASFYDCGTLGTRTGHPDHAKAGRFQALLDAEAWTSAAEMLVGDGWHVAEMGMHYDIPLRANGPYFAVIVQKQSRMMDGGSGGSADPYSRCMNAQHPATALLAAVVRSTEETDDAS